MFVSVSRKEEKWMVLAYITAFYIHIKASVGVFYVLKTKNI